jgi:hypothetical protein
MTEWTRRSAHAAHDDLIDLVAELTVGPSSLVRSVRTQRRRKLRLIPLPPSGPTYWTSKGYPMPDRATCQHHDGRNQRKCGKPSRLYYPQDNGSQPALCVEHAREQSKR